MEGLHANPDGQDRNSLPLRKLETRLGMVAGRGVSDAHARARKGAEMGKPRRTRRRAKHRPRARPRVAATRCQDVQAGEHEDHLGTHDSQDRVGIGDPRKDVTGHEGPILRREGQRRHAGRAP